ncbi:hypothetical protein FOA52_011423 [Chlamydomonas sp. UWO 241]|nr:hypothetical protein FOA52_011423 [Chlamydomonas sp. UWO 241]
MRDKKKPSTAPTRTASIDPGDYCYGVPSADAVCHLMAVFMFHHAAAHFAMFHHAATHCVPPPYGRGGNTGQSVAARGASVASGCRHRRDRSRPEGAVKARKTVVESSGRPCIYGGSVAGTMAPLAPSPSPFRSPFEFRADVDAPLPRGAVSSLLLLDDDDECGGGIDRSRDLAPLSRSDVLGLLDVNDGCHGGGGGCDAQLQGGSGDA